MLLTLLVVFKSISVIGLNAFMKWILEEKSVWTVFMCVYLYFYCEMSEVSCLSKQRGYNTTRRIQSSAVWRKQWHKSLPETLGHCQTQGYVNPFIFLLNTRYFEHSVRNLDTNLFCVFFFNYFFCDNGGWLELNTNSSKFFIFILGL